MVKDTKKPHVFDKRSYDIANDTRKFEIKLFWGFIAAAFIGYTSLLKHNADTAIIIAIFGLICSICWTLANRGSKFWQEHWELYMNECEKKLGNIYGKPHFQKKRDNGIIGSARYSVSKLAIVLSDFTVLVWAFLIFNDIIKIYNLCDCLLLIPLVLSLFYLPYAFIISRSSIKEEDIIRK